MTKLKVRVTKDILEESKYCGIDGYQWLTISTSCGIVVAVRDIFPNAQVGLDMLVFDMKFPLTTSPLPYEATKFIKQFDRSTPEERVLMPEFEFEISIPDDVIEKINIDDLVNHQTLELSF